MITREEAAEYVRLIEASHGPRDRRLDDARTIVALHDEVERLRREADDAARGEDRMTAACEAARAEVATLTTALRLAEASVSLLRADLATRDAMLESERDLSGKLETEIRRLRAAEAPGTDDEAFEGTGWISRPERPGHGWWTHANPSKPGLNVIVGRARNGRSGWIICGAPGNGWGAKAYPVALDAMRAAVPGSV